MPTQSISLAGSFKGRLTDDEPLFNEHYGARYVRYQGWKMVSLAKDTTWNLYHIKDDATEINDVSAANPDKVKELAAMWHQWAVQNKVYPKPHH